MIREALNIPEPTLRRLVQISSLLQRELEKGKSIISSTQIGKDLGVEAHTIRKDINILGGTGDSTTGYNIERLLKKIILELGLATQINGCIVGLGRLGEALINYPLFKMNGIEIIAAFDININKLETLKTEIPLFPAYEMADVIKQKAIEVAIIAVPISEVDKTIDKLIHSGIKGILNYTGAVLPHHTQEGVYIRNLDINGELNMLKVLMNRSIKNISNTNK